MDADRIPLSVDAISLLISDEVRRKIPAADLFRVIEGLNVVLHAGTLNLSINLSWLPVWGAPIQLGTVNGEMLPRVETRSERERGDKTTGGILNDAGHSNW